MKVIEATFSFLVLCSLLPFLIYDTNQDFQKEYYYMKVSQDILRVLYLKGDFEDFNKSKLNFDLIKIRESTGICVVIEEQDVASCIPKMANVVVKRVAFINGQPKIITITFGV
ncbi:MAG: hypothetical protein WC501_04745 [Candidatus Micrarchaeia archaeon]